MVFIWFYSFGLINRLTNLILLRSGREPFVYTLFFLQAATRRRYAVVTPSLRHRGRAATQ